MNITVLFPWEWISSHHMAKLVFSMHNVYPFPASEFTQSKIQHSTPKSTLWCLSQLVEPNGVVFIKCNNAVECPNSCCSKEEGSGRLSQLW